MHIHSTLMLVPLLVFRKALGLQPDRYTSDCHDWPQFLVCHNR